MKHFTNAACAARFQPGRRSGALYAVLYLILMMGSLPLAAQVGESGPLATGDDYGCTIRPNGQIKCWGNNDRGQVGDGTTSPRQTPVAVSDISGAVDVAAGTQHTCVVLANGTLWCFGENQDGQLGNGERGYRTSPQKVIWNIPVFANGFE